MSFQIIGFTAARCAIVEKGRTAVADRCAAGAAICAISPGAARRFFSAEKAGAQKAPSAIVQTVAMPIKWPSAREDLDASFMTISFC
ncbi:MAG: hypothetical protein HOP03_15475 [Lysobacter sp.]|nr:hypothetical protein [Lysobacter sp.]